MHKSFCTANIITHKQTKCTTHRAAHPNAWGCLHGSMNAKAMLSSCPPSWWHSSNFAAVSNSTGPVQKFRMTANSGEPVVCELFQLCISFTTCWPTACEASSGHAIQPKKPITKRGPYHQCFEFQLIWMLELSWALEMRTNTQTWRGAVNKPDDDKQSST